MHLTYPCYKIYKTSYIYQFNIIVMKKWTVYVYDVIHVCDNVWYFARFYCLFIFLLPLAIQLPREKDIVPMNRFNIAIFLYLTQARITNVVIQMYVVVFVCV